MTCAGIFVPDNYSPKPEIDLIVYLHGHNDKAQCFEQPGVVPIDKYWKSTAFALRERVNDSGKNVILVAPTLGPTSQAGRLTCPCGFDDYLDQVMAALIAYGPYQKAKQAPALGNVILACHSGGGSPMLGIVRGHDRSTANVRECWGFDCLYSGYADKEKTQKLFTQPEGWIEWAKLNKTKMLYIYYKESTQRESKYLDCRSQGRPPAKGSDNLDCSAKSRKVSNVIVEGSNAASHCSVPLTHWGDRLKGVPFLSDR
jgi:hypothetical protein